MGLFPKLKIAHRLPLAVVGSALIVSAGVGIASYFIASSTVGELSERRMRTIAAAQGDQLETYLEDVQKDLVITVAQDFLQMTLRDFTINWNQFLTMEPKADPTKILPEIYIANNPNPAGQRQLLDVNTSAKRTQYDFTHGRVQANFRRHMEARGYLDMFLFDTAGNLVYSVRKQDDFATNFGEDGRPYAASGLGRAYRAAMAITEPGKVVFEDLSRYAPSGNLPSAFVATPVFDVRQKLIGVMAVQLPVTAFNTMMGGDDSLGVSGESLLVGEDRLLRNDSPFSQVDDTLVATYTNPIVEQALAGKTASGETTGYRSAVMLATAVPVTFNGTNWAMVTTISEDEVYAPIDQMRTAMLGIGLVLLALVAAAGLVYSRSIARPITRMTGTIGALARGDLDVKVEKADGHDEIGEMARAVEVFRDNALKVKEMTEGERANSERRRFERTQMMQALQQAFGEVVDAAIAGDFSKRVEADFPDPELNTLAASVNNLVATVDRGMSETGNVLAALARTDLASRVEGNYEGAFQQLKSDTNAVAEKLTEIVLQLRDTSRALKSATGEILAGANDLSERTTKQAGTIEETSAAMEQLASTVQQNAQRAKDASVVAANATHAAEDGGKVMTEATEAMERITSSSSKISSIIGLIDDIAFQTNLLALNASVEAARAGEAGRGFAVVAVEVRRLAQSAAQASSEVKVLVEQSSGEVKAGSKLVVEAAQKLDAILSAARAANDLMDEIARDSQDQASSIEEVNAAVRQMDEMTQHNAALVEETNATIERTEEQAVELDRIVDIFTIGKDDRAPAAEPTPTPAPAAARPAPKPGIAGLQEKVRQAARTYLSQGNAAIDDKEWSEF